MIHYSLKRIEFKITDECNMHCVYCGNNDSRNNRTSNRMPLQVVRQIISDLSENELYEVVFTGGEPTLLGEDLVRLVDFAASYGLRVQVNTNGTQIDESLRRDLTNAGLNVLHFSVDTLDGNLFSHFRGTSDPSCLERTLSNLIGATQMSRLYTIAEATVTTLNLSHLAHIYDFCASIGVDCFELQALIPVGRAGWSMVAPLNDIQTELRSLYQNRQPKTALLFSCIYGGACLMNSTVLLPTDGCRCGRSSAYISSNGSVWPCSFAQTIPELCAGSVLKGLGKTPSDRLINLWNDCDVFKYIRSTLPFMCRKCGYVEVCSNMCMLIPYTLWGDMGRHSLGCVSAKLESLLTDRLEDTDE